MSGKKTEIYKIVKYIVQYVHQNKKGEEIWRHKPTCAVRR